MWHRPLIPKLWRQRPADLWEFETCFLQRSSWTGRAVNTAESSIKQTNKNLKTKNQSKQRNKKENPKPKNQNLIN